MMMAATITMPAIQAAALVCADLSDGLARCLGSKELLIMFAPVSHAGDNNAYTVIGNFWLISYRLHECIGES